jgi:hypothetical protein
MIAVYGTELCVSFAGGHGLVEKSKTFFFGKYHQFVRERRYISEIIFHIAL